MKVLYISFRINARDGSSVHGRAFVDHVARLGHEIRVYPSIEPLDAAVPAASTPKTIFYYLKRLRLSTLKHYARMTNARVAELIDFWSGITDSVGHLRRLRRVLEDFRPDVIVARHTLFQFAPLWLARRSGIPCVVEVNSLSTIEAGISRDRKLSWIARWAERWAIRAADGVFAVSKSVQDSVDAVRGRADSKVIPNGVSFEQFDPQQHDASRVKAELGLTGKTVLGYVGSYKGWHGLDVSIDVIDKLAAIDPSFHLLLIGNGQDFGAVKTEILRRGLQHHVTQLPAQPHDRIAHYLAAFDFALMTYPVIDGFYFSPLKMFEYLAMGIPVVTTDIGQIGEVIRDGETGALVSPPTVDGFVAAIRNVVRCPERVVAMQRACRRLATEQFSWTDNAREVIALCQQTLERRATGNGQPAR